MIDLIKSRAKAHFEQLVQIRRHLHANPELSFNEHQTAVFVLKTLCDYGIDAKPHSETGVVALISGELGEAKEVTALRADLDALPIHEENEVDYRSTKDRVMHACGHDVHTTSLLGTAMILYDLKSKFSGTVKLIFQPGEEKLPGGASLMIKNGILQNPKPGHIIGQHVFPELEVGKVGFRSGKYMASCDEIYLKVLGKGGHGALPHKNIDPILIASHIVVAMQQIISRRSDATIPSVLSFGRIIGEGATNVIPDQVSLDGTFRTYDEKWRLEAHKLIEKLAKSTAEAMGGKCEVNIVKGYPFVKNDPDLTAIARSLAESYLGKENVIELDMRPTGEDFSYYTQEMPGTFYRLGVRNEKKGIIYPVHSSRFDVDEKSIEIGCGLMAWLAINNLKQ
ncbi:MAG: M20 family metallopeptidase [Salibacteraceae bacterium]